MITSKNRITRRTVLRGAGGISVALPFLDAMLLPGRSHAASSIPMRFVVFYSPGGTLLDQWRTDGHGDELRVEQHDGAAQPVQGSLDSRRRPRHVRRDQQRGRPSA